MSILTNRFMIKLRKAAASNSGTTLDDFIRNIPLHFEAIRTPSNAQFQETELGDLGYYIRTLVNLLLRIIPSYLAF